MDSKHASQILSYLYLGGRNDAKGKEQLHKLNIKYVLNCTPPRTQDKEAGCPNFYEKERLFVYKRIPIFDNKGEDIISHMDTAFKFIEEGKHYGNVLVHCHSGISRSASFVIGYLMRKNELTYDEALSHVQGCRSIVSPNTAFAAQLKAYQLPKTLSFFPQQQQQQQHSSSLGSRDSSNHASLKDDFKPSTDSSRGPSIRYSSEGPSIGPSIGPCLKPSAEGPSTGPSIGPPIEYSTDSSVPFTNSSVIGPTIDKPQRPFSSSGSTQEASTAVDHPVAGRRENSSVQNELNEEEAKEVTADSDVEEYKQTLKKTKLR